MAFLNKLKEKIDDEEIAGIGNQPQLAGEQGSLEGGNAMSGYTSPNKTGTSGFVDVHAYLDANKDQAQETANKIGTKVGEQVEQLRGKVKTAEDAFNQKLEQGTTKKNPALVDAAFSDPAGFVKDPNNVSGFKSLRDAIYGGPKSFEELNEFSPASSAAKEGTRIAAGVNNPQGREELLYRVSKKPTAGNIALDSLLVGGNEDARKTLEESTKPFGEINSYLDTTAAGAKDRIAAAQEETLGARDYAQSRLDAETKKFQDDLNARVGGARSKAQEDADFLKAGIERGAGLTDAELSGTGMTRDAWDELLKTKKNLEVEGPFSNTKTPYGQKFDLLDYYSSLNPDVEITNENFASADDYAKEKALQQLADNGQWDVLGDDASKAGTAPSSIASFRGQDAYGDSAAKLHALDQQFVDEYQGFNLGWGPGTEEGWRELLKDPRQAQAYTKLADIFERAPGASDMQKRVAGRLRGYIAEGNALGPNEGGGGDAFKQPDEFETNNLRTITDSSGKGVTQWWNGKEWTEAPHEYIYRDAQGNQTGPSVGSQPWRFDYNTGQYVKYGDVIQQGDAPGTVTTDDGHTVRTGGKIPGVVGAL